MPFDLDTPRTLFEKGVKAVDWVVEEIVRQKNWRSLLVLLDVIMFIAFNPFQWPFPNLLSLYPQLEKSIWYGPVFWSLVGVIFVIAVVVAARAKPKPSERPELKLGAIKGLLPFGYEDAEVFSHLQRDQNLKECLQAIGDEQWRLGVLSGESGTGKTSFLQAGLWPEMEKRKFRCVYVKFSDLDPFESVKRACFKHLSIADGANDTADFPGLLRAATEQDRTPIVLLFDQFEQFFVHRKRKKDREPFAQALTQWFAEMRSLPVKILICVRGDFFDRLNELQKAIRYSLSPTQSFRLERFEPDQATEVFCFLAEKEGLEYDRKFISEMTRQELADAEDGLISPVDIQVLARMIERQTTQGARAFNRATFQKLGGVEGLLERYLTTALEPLVTQSRRQAAIKVLLALTDLERNARAGALTFEDLRQKLGGDITDSELKEAISYLLLSDVRLISPSSENEEEKFELAHERLIPALRRLAGKQLNEADRADQLLDRRTNEWLGAERSSRYLFSWSELRLISKHKRFVTWGKQRQAKEELLAASWRSFTLQFATVALVILLAAIGRAGWNSNAWQTYLIKRELRDYGVRLNDRTALTDIAKAFAYAGDSRFTLRVVNRIGDDSSKAAALREIADSYAELGDKEKVIALLSNAIKTAERIGDDDDRSKSNFMLQIAQFYAKLGETMRDGALLKEAINTADRIGDPSPKASALSEIARSYAKLGGTMKDGALLKEALKTAEWISDDLAKAHALSQIAKSYAELGEKMRDGALLEESLKTAERIGDPSPKTYALRDIAESYAKLGDKEKARALFSDAIRAAERTTWFRAQHLSEIAKSYAKLGETMKDGALLEESLKTAERISDDLYEATGPSVELYKAYALNAIARSYAKLGDKEKARALLSDAIKTAERMGDDPSKPYPLRDIAESYAKLGETMRDGALLKESLKTAERISDDQAKADALSAIARSYAELGETMKDTVLLSDVIKTAKQIRDGYSKVSALSAIAESYAKLGDMEMARVLFLDMIKTVEWIRYDQSKAYALSDIIKFYARFAESLDDSALYDVVLRLIEGLRNDHDRNRALDAILSSKLATADAGRLRLLASHYGSEVEKVRALARILTACSHPELIGKEKMTTVEDMQLPTPQPPPP